MAMGLDGPPSKTEDTITNIFFIVMIVVLIVMIVVLIATTLGAIK